MNFVIEHLSKSFEKKEVLKALHIRDQYRYRVSNKYIKGECYQQLLKPVFFRKDIMANLVKEQNNKLISEDVTITSKRKGF